MRVDGLLVEERQPAPAPATHWLARVRYRIGQFLRGLTAAISAEEQQLVAGTLPPGALALFLRMPKDAQRHSLNVLHTLQATGEVPADLAVAALLHDVGKVAATDAGAYLGLWLRGPTVLLEAVWPGLLARLADPTPSSQPGYALYVQIHHPAIGAAWAKAAGCSELACWLIEHHQDSHQPGSGTREALLARLRAADGAN
ncbi:MAG: HD domain-containing protein [Caldilineaceae bacterium]|nr:HD domain-containing protein [Caldilineaceae bacterium]